VGAEQVAAEASGVGPGAVRFISGTYEPHVELEVALAEFHGRTASMVAGSAYTAVAGVLSSLSTPETVLVSDELNHNCIVNGMKLAPNKARKVYGHLDLRALEQRLEESIAQAEGALVITDGVFSMRGDHAPVDRIAALCRKYDPRFPRGCVLIVDDSHGVGGFETIPGQHPGVPLMVRDTERTGALVRFLRENGVLATGLNYPVVPRGEQLIRFQVSADHTEADIDAVLSVLSRFK